ncbi:MAG: hypothetical protein WA621_10425 [Candidatus Acidiferrum sp.]|jgi:hypothetical protein
MSTVPQATLSEAVVSVSNKRSSAAPTSRRGDDQFFLAMAVFILGTVFLGFARTFYLAGIYHTHLPNRLIAVHGTVFTAWVVLLVVQTGLVAGRRISVHRALGLFGAALAASMVILGLAAATDSLARGFAPPSFPFGSLTFYATPVFAMITFATLIAAGLWMRSNGPAHKRLVLLATITLLPAAIGRWPFAVMSRVHFIVNVIVFLFVLLVAAFDLWSLRRIHPATMRGGIFLTLMVNLAIPVGTTSAWQRFAGLALRFWQGSH